MIAPPLLEGRARYERVVEGWSDAIPDDAFTHTVRVASPEAEVEATAVALPPPSYLIRALRARARGGTVDPAAVAGLAALDGTALVAGLGRRVREATGPGAGAALLLDGVVEIARLARQVNRLPRARVARAFAGDVIERWHLDREGWADLPDSCFTYQASTAALFAARPVASPVTADLYSPGPDQPRVFERRRRLGLERTGDRLRLFHAMHDNAHVFEVTYVVELASGRIEHAESFTPKLPYAGVCSEPQPRIRALIGETLEPGLLRRIQGLLGGAAGCAQLFDLTADLLRLAVGPRVY